jgi:HAD superfamily hydrolase (TIGR01509 family)
MTSPYNSAPWKKNGQGILSSRRIRKLKHMKYKAVIFDMDGLLLDTERIALDAFVASCRECNFEPDIGVYTRCIGTTSHMTREILTTGYGPGFPFETISGIWKKRYLEEVLTKPVPLKPGVLALLKQLDKLGVKKAVVTSTERELAKIKLTNAGIEHFFLFILGRDQVSQGKPNPEIYLTACRMLNEAPSDCLALEDSENGVLAAHSAGLTVIQVPDLVKPSEKIIALGHRIVNSLEEVPSLII